MIQWLYIINTWNEMRIFLKNDLKFQSLATEWRAVLSNIGEILSKYKQLNSANFE